MAKMQKKNNRAKQRPKKEKEVKKQVGKKIVKPIKKMTDRGLVNRNPKKSENKKKGPENNEKYLKINPSTIGCKIKRQVILFKRQNLLKRLKEQKRKEDKKNPERVIEKPKDIEDKREILEELLVDEEEVAKEELYDEFSSYFSEGKKPKVLLTTSKTPSAKMFPFLKEIKSTLPFCFYYPRGSYSIAELAAEGWKRDYTCVMVWRESRKKLQELVLVHLPAGPTAVFKVTSDVLNMQIANHGNPTDHFPELVINNFNSHVGRRIARFFATLFPPAPEFHARTVCTFHNQRDFIFFRRHRYMFNQQGDDADLQEIGPRFTLKLKTLQKGIYDRNNGQTEFCVKTEMYQSRRKYFL